MVTDALVVKHALQNSDHGCLKKQPITFTYMVKKQLLKNQRMHRKH